MTNHQSESLHSLIFCVAEHTAHGMGAARSEESGIHSGPHVPDGGPQLPRRLQVRTQQRQVGSKYTQASKPKWGGFGQDWNVSYLKKMFSLLVPEKELRRPPPKKDRF